MARSLTPRNRPHTPARKPFELPEGFIRKYVERARAELSHQFKGITTDGNVVAGLFPIQQTGVSTQPLVEAAEKLLASVGPRERAKISFAVESDAWRSWSNIHPYLMRHGICFEDFNETQRGLALALVRETLSAAGFETARNVMRLNDHIRELTGRSEEYGEWLYWLSILGAPSATDPWGWQIDGHHLVINCFVVGDQLVLTPNFMGSEPVVAESGKYVGTRVLQEEEAKGLALMKALTSDQRRKATIGSELPFDGMIAAFRDNLQMKYEGIGYSELSREQQALLVALIETYIGRIRPGHAEIKLEEVKQHLPETYFAWIGGCDDESTFYYRVHSPVILIEFDHQPGVALDNDEPSRNHVHTVVRTPNGNDYGKDLLRQHYERFDHSHPHSAHRRGLE
jgi:hypothetical protein